MPSEIRLVKYDSAGAWCWDRSRRTPLRRLVRENPDSKKLTPVVPMNNVSATGKNKWNGKDFSGFQMGTRKSTPGQQKGVGENHGFAARNGSCFFDRTHRRVSSLSSKLLKTTILYYNRTDLSRAFFDFLKSTRLFCYSSAGGGA